MNQLSSRPDNGDLTKEWYDQDAHLVRVDEKPLPGNEVLVDRSTKTNIMDFDAGLSYIIAQDTGHCEVTPIMYDVFNTKTVDSASVRLTTPSEFFHFDSGNFVYSGQTTIRGIPAETWIGHHNDFPPGYNGTSQWQWYFSSDEWALSQFGQPLHSPVPLLLKIDVPEENLHFSFNIFNFSPKDPG
ncbi:uncharacterized protein LOC101863694, partial [Aplysia californica]|uniref:Uncharacterized protein LOC101863694 n=1 Tax=Aplysia californica TaxID=6500 RepID=A0ABM1A7Z8_APLCA